MQILLTVNFDDSALHLSDATAMEIDYRNPNGVIGSWTGVLNDDNIIQANVPANSLNVVGDWTIWSKVTFGALVFIGSPSNLYITNIGQ